jgi:SAM-dependent methyltransferase
MSTAANLILEVLSPGQGMVLDLAGGRGGLRQPLENLGYRYINLDIRQFENGEPSLTGDAHTLPFKDASFDLVVSKDTLEHFVDPWTVVKEVHRVLKQQGRFVIWVPFMHPFHGDDIYRYSPLGLRRLLGDFEIITFESPLWVLTIIGGAVTEVMKRLHLGFIEPPLKRLCGALDRLLTRHQQRPASFAPAYRIVARKPGQLRRSADGVAAGRLRRSASEKIL